MPSPHNGVTHVYLRQRVNGLEIDGAEMGIHIDRLGRIFHRTGAFVRAAGERAAATPALPALTPDMAVRAAARELGLRGREAELAVVDSAGGFDLRTVYSSPELSEEEIPVRLRYFRTPESDRLTLAWNLNLKVTGGSDWLDLWVDAASGAIVGRVNWTAEVDATYSVFASPKESPDDGARTDEVDPDLAGGINPATGASPYGWHDTNGVPGAETFVTSRQQRQRLHRHRRQQRLRPGQPAEWRRRTAARLLAGDRPLDAAAGRLPRRRGGEPLLLEQHAARHRLPVRIRRGCRQLPGEQLRRAAARPATRSTPTPRTARAPTMPTSRRRRTAAIRACRCSSGPTRSASS